MNTVSIIVPIYNEERNLIALTERIHSACTDAHITYEIIYIDDHSTDRTDLFIKFLQDLYPIRFFKKQGKKGKAFSLLEGFAKARYNIIAMIDGDLQYPPEAIPEMVEKLGEADIIVAKREERHTSPLRKLTSRGFNLIFGQMMHRLSVDIQSGLKVFKKEIVEKLVITPSPWTYDLEFLVKARSAGYTIAEVPIIFSERQHGKSHVKLFQTIYEIGLSAIKLKAKMGQVTFVQNMNAENKSTQFLYKGTTYAPHTTLDLTESAFFQLTPKQKLIACTLIALYTMSFIINWHLTLVLTIAVLTIFYFSDIFFNLFLIQQSLRSEKAAPKKPVDAAPPLLPLEWPSYTIFCPLYREWRVVPQFIESMKKLSYPKDKLQVLLLLEENDEETIKKIRGMDLPSYFEVIIVPHSLPKTKPKACNYGLQFARGQYAVIYDAEDIPEIDQLEKAVHAFQTSNESLVCVQAKLNFYNPLQNFLTRLFTAEYSLWFDLILPGLQSIHAPIPLGGTSNHFKTSILKDLEGWDSFNVTEDCDLGIRLAKKGYTTAIIDSTTYEEANSDLKNWFTQRSRWIKGYIQTYLVHIRDFREFTYGKSSFNLLAFQFIIGGKVLSLFINPLMWVIFISYFSLRPILGTFIESFYPAPVLYMAVIAVVFGNFLYFYYYMLGFAKRGLYQLIIFGFLIPFYWMMMSIAAWIAVYSFIRNPFYWAKTRHGLHLSEDAEEEQPVPKFSWNIPYIQVGV